MKIILILLMMLINDIDFIHAVDDRMFTMLGEVMAKIKNGNIHTNILQGMFGERPSSTIDHGDHNKAENICS